MFHLIKLAILIVFLLPTLFVSGSGQAGIFDKFDAFGDIKCEDEYARLDNFAIQLEHDSQAKGVIIFYGGKMFRGKLPKRGEAAARAARLKPHLVKRRGIPSSRVIVINGGYSPDWKAELWIVPKGMSMPTPFSTVGAGQIKFRKGKASPRDYRCRI
jgi:hypothetical protein